MKADIPIYDIQNLNAYKNDGILVSRFGAYANNHQHLHTPHRHSFYHLVYFNSGSGTQQIDFKTFQVKPGIIYFMTPGQVHSWRFDNEPDGYIINFSTDYLNSFLLKPDYLNQFTFFNGQPEQQVLTLPVITQEKLTTIFEQILKEGESNLLLNDDLVKSLLVNLFIEVARSEAHLTQQLASSYNHTLLRNFKQLIEQNFAQLRLPKSYAALLYITPNHLNAVCKDFLGISAGQLIRERVILEAKRLLINLDISIGEIASKLHFEDQSYFIKFFKKYEAITPDKFRKQNTIPHGNSTK